MPKKPSKLKKIFKAKNKNPKLKSKKGNRHSFLVDGELRIYRDGYGFVLPKKPDSPDVFIPRNRLNGAMHLDQVRVSASVDDRGRLDGAVIKILDRGMRKMVGQFVYYGDHAYVKVMQGHRELLVRVDKNKKAQEGQLVGVEILEFGEKPRGKIVEILGLAGENQAETLATITKHGLATVFGDAAMAEALALEKRGVEIDAERVDLREHCIVTIDGETARDFDDAICVKREGKFYRIWISIADVSHYVTPGSALDKEALNRGTSVYFPEFCIPMLPEQLSNHLCSLVPAQDRLCFTAELRLSHQGKVVDTHFYKSIIRSKARLTYTWVKHAIIDGDVTAQLQHPHVVAMLQEAVGLAKILRKKRDQRGGIDFDLPEPFFVLGEDQEPLNIIKAERHFAHMLIEEFMILANEAVATFAMHKELPFIYRIHERPEPDKVFALNELLHNMGVKKRIPGNFKPADFSVITDAVKGQTYERLVNHVMLRSMKQAVYATRNPGHFGLALENYSHFTSPIRRYPDLMIHRLLDIYLKKKQKSPKQTISEEKIQSVASHCSKRERIAMEAEWEVQALKVAQFMEDKVGNQYSGLISRVAKFGFFVELADFFVEGLVHVDDLEEDYYEFDPAHHHLLGRRKKQIYKIGDPISIIVSNVSISERQVRFEITS